MNTSILSQNNVSQEVVNLISRLIPLIPWPSRRQAMGDVAISILNGKARLAEEVFGWCREGVALGINESRTGIACINDISTRHNKRVEEKDPDLFKDIEMIMEPSSNSDERLRTTLLHTNMTAKAVHQSLIEMGRNEESLPTVCTIDNILNRNGYKLRTVAKTKVQKKTKETDAIFENVWRENALADSCSDTLRISIDTKATVNVCESSRGGKSRGLKAVQASDHDMHIKEKLVPGGILEPVTGKSFIFFGNSYKTSDFMVDGIIEWWNERKDSLSNIKVLVINIDNGPECSGHRSQFLHRMMEFADATGLIIRLIYYPPYHSKYNNIERYWAGLEQSWNGYLLDSVTTVLNRAENFVWKGMRSTVMLLEGKYEKGIKLCAKAKKALESRLSRLPALQWWDITISPKMVV
jgi:hypothetical protein